MAQTERTPPPGGVRVRFPHVQARLRFRRSRPSGSPFRGGLPLALLCLASVAPPAAGQQTYLSGWGGMFMDPGSVQDGESNTTWDFGTSFAVGAAVQRRLGGPLLAGIELGYSSMKHEVRDRTSGLVRDEGRAQVITLLAAGRLGAGRAAGVGTYLTGGIGTMVYGIPHLDRWDPDFALRGGGGVEYVPSRTFALFLEWTRWWVFHQSEGVEDNTVNHGQLQLGFRYGL